MTDQDDKRARDRFILLNLVRLVGLAMVLSGIAIHFRRIDAPEVVAYVLVFAGLIEFFFIPNFVARSWRTPDV